MKPAHFFVIGGILLLLAGASLVGVTPSVAQGPTTTPPPPITDPVGQPPTFLFGVYQAWVASPHAKVDAEAFVHWNAEQKIPTACSTCHSTPGYLDFLGVDGSEAGKVDLEAPVGSVVNCDACHNSAASTLATVKFPSGAEVGDMGDSTRCMICHQGRSSTVQVNAAIEKAALGAEVNKPTDQLRFINIHYYAAAASIYGSEAQGGYQYEGKSYQRRYTHVEGYDTCAGCHDPHTLQLDVAQCATCHEDVKTVEDLRQIRMQGSLSDYDGDGSIDEGVYGEIVGLQEALYKTMQEYASKVVGTAIVYDSARYPYYFADANANGAVDEGEKGYAAFSVRLLQAAYNYQVSKKDPGNYAHNAAYHIELLFDSIESLMMEMGGDTGMGAMVRNDPGHFDATSESFRHWDEDGEVSGTCARCHTSVGLPVYLKNKANIAAKPSTSLACSTCHDKIPGFSVYAAADATFPSGKVVTFGERSPDNLCLNCHQGRESTVSVNRAITTAKVGDDEVSDKLTFRNIHYFAAGASLFGNDTQGAYQFEGKEYVGRNEHDEGVQTCTDCHDTHALKVNFEKCLDCHEDVEAPDKIRSEDNDVDYDGDGNVTEPIADEIASLREALLVKIYAYATKTAGASIVYESHSHPYWFIDTNANGQADADEVKSDNRFNKWTPNLLRAAYNYQFSSKDPGAYVHNAPYILQVLYDSLEVVGGAEAVTKFKRP